MEETKPAPMSYVTPAPAAGSKGQYIQKTPLWVVVVRGLQAFFAFIIICLCGYLIHGKALDAYVFALVVCLMTWTVVAYSVLTEKIPGANGAYNIWAVLSLDLLLAIFWLSSMGANAALRASFIYSVDVEYCINDGSAVNSNHCVVSKRDLQKRAALAGPVGRAVMSAIAGLSALMMLFFIATLVFHGHTFRLYHQSNKSTPTDNATVEMTAQQTSMPASQQAPVQAPQQAPFPEYPSQPQQPQSYQGYPQAPPQGTVSPVYSHSVPSTAYPHPTPSPAPVSTPSPAPYQLAQGHMQQQAGPYQLPGQEYGQQQPGPYQLAGSQPHSGYANPNQVPYQQYPTHSPQGTPAPGQPYYPPAH